MPGLTQYSGIVLPSSIPANFAGKFGQLCELTNSVPFGIPGLGTDAPSPAPLAPLLAIDGSPRQDSVSGLTAAQYQEAFTSSTGLVRDFDYLNDLLDRHSPNQNSVRGLLALFHHSEVTDDSSPINRGPGDSIMMRTCTPEKYGEAREASDAYDQSLNYLRAASLRSFQIENLTTPPDDKMESEYAEYVLTRGAIHAGFGMLGSEHMGEVAKEDFALSAILFAGLHRSFAAPMIYENARVIEEKIKGQPSNKTLFSEAMLWIDALVQSDSISFNVAYPRALHAAWAAGHPGNGLMEAVFKTGMEQMIPRKNTYAIHAITATLGAAWARLMKADLTTATDLETPLSEQDYIQGDITDLNALPLSGEDWIEVYNRLQTAEDLLSGQAFEITLSLRQIISKINPSVADYRAAANWHTLFLPGKLPGQK